ncbi:3-isopropylmalate dehydratase small subunit [Dongshaea marina]|uniref:3-isopropylmalate dehydratase small subunit n=1 Tax=Dongshaea marina TaxID=2047966 RepID=UPI000D3E444D|nr:3-isopropylmalate dehydratase small subunit [Dongshaea marina]
MRAFTQHRGIAAPLNIANIDTDQLIPKQFLQKTTRSGFGQHLFHDWRFEDDAGEQENPNFILNQGEYRNASILLAGENFGCGSSREHAPWALSDYGFRAIIAPSFADIFYGNAINNGLLPIRLAEDTVSQLMDRASQGESIEICLEQCRVESRDEQYSFEIDSFHRHRLLHGLDSIGMTLEHAGKIEDYEKEQPAWL